MHINIVGLGIPTYGLALVVSHRDNLNSQTFKAKYGFLYNGYRPQAYFWEFVIMYRKIIIIIIRVLMAQLGKIVQVREFPHLILIRPK